VGQHRRQRQQIHQCRAPRGLTQLEIPAKQRDRGHQHTGVKEPGDPLRPSAQGKRQPDQRPHQDEQRRLVKHQGHDGDAAMPARPGCRTNGQQYDKDGEPAPEPPRRCGQFRACGHPQTGEHEQDTSADRRDGQCHRSARHGKEGGGQGNDYEARAHSPLGRPTRPSLAARLLAHRPPAIRTLPTLVRPSYRPPRRVTERDALPRR
jgi:hypothetical protein